jgi:4-aminobutyrate aminotransferase-like enzyme
VPDLLCLGKGMGGGMPVSACIGSSRVMYSWGASTGEAIHTSTFLGHPLGCAVALAVITEIQQRKLVDRSRAMGDHFRKELWKLKEKYPVIQDVRGAGLMIGMELRDQEAARRFGQESLKSGMVVLSSGPAHNVVSLTPPLIISEHEIAACVKLFDKILQKLP